MGPIGYLIVEFPGSKMTGEGLPVLVDLVDRGVIRILDLAFIMKDDGGSVHALEISDFDGDGQFNLAVFDGVSSGLLDEEDVREGGAALEPGSSGAMLIYENRWAAPLTDAIRRGGGELVAAGFVPLEAIAASLDALDAVSP